MKTAAVHSRIQPEIKERTETILHRLGDPVERSQEHTQITWPILDRSRRSRPASAPQLPASRTPIARRQGSAFVAFLTFVALA